MQRQLSAVMQSSAIDPKRTLEPRLVPTSNLSKVRSLALAMGDGASMDVRAASVAIFALAASGCQNAPQPQLAPSYSASVVVDAEQCTSTCDLIMAKVRVTNNGTDLLCIPSVYSDENGYGALFLAYQANGEPLELTEGYDPNRFLSPRYKEDMLEFADLTQRVVQPGQTVEITMRFFRKFDLGPLPTTATLRFVGFACRQVKGKPAAQIEDLKTDVRFR